MDWQTIDIPLGGLDTKSDEYLIDPPGFAVLQDAEFDDHGGIRARKPFAEILDSASNTIADIRKIVPYGDELVAFSKDKLWSYASGDGEWIERAEYLAPKVTEQARFVTPREQYDCDRAELGGIVFFVWRESGTFSDDSYIAAIDKETCAVKLSPTSLGSGSGCPRLLASTNVVFLAFFTTNTLNVRTYDPSDLSTYSSATTTATGIANLSICSDGSTGAYIGVRRSTTSYYVQHRSEALTLVSAVGRTRTVSGPVAVSFDPVGQNIVVLFNNGTSVIADIYDSDFGSSPVEEAVGTASGTPVNQVDVLNTGENAWDVVWSAAEETGGNAFYSRYNTLTFSGSLASGTGSLTAGTDASIILRAGVASKLFRYNSETFVWLVFAGRSSGALEAQLQNVYMLYRVDGTLIGKAVAQHAGGFSATAGHLPGVQSLGANRYAFAGQYRRIIPLGEGSDRGYAARSVHDVMFEFDSDEARRTAVLGETLYISGSMLMQYDGRSLTEVGFLYYPFDLSIIASGAGSLTGTYNWQQTWSWFNAKGEFERSSTATIYSQAMTSNEASIVVLGLHSTLRTDSESFAAIEVWRQEADAGLGANFFLVTSKDPADYGSDNGYLYNQPLLASETFADNLSDALLLGREPYPENGGLVLANLAPPGCTIVVATQDKLMLAGIPGSPHRIAYSKLRGQGEIAAFNDALYLDLPPEGGAITALGFLNETLIAFKATAIYAVPGDGYDNTGGGQNYGPARLLSADIGAVNAESVALVPGGLIFKSSKGWYLLNQGWQVQYIGGAVSDFDADTVRAVHVMTSQHQVRCLTDSRMLVWDYLVPAVQGQIGAWSEWSVGDGVSACVQDGVYHYSDGSRVLAQQTDWSEDSATGAGVSTTTLVVGSGLTTLPVDSVDGFPGNGWIVIDDGGASEETVQYTAVVAGGTVTRITEDGSARVTEADDTRAIEGSEGGSFTLATATVNAHVGSSVDLIIPEEMGLDLETGWISISGLQDYKNARSVSVLGRYKGAHRLRVRIAYDYESAWVEDKMWTPSPTTIDGRLQVRHRLARPKCESFKLRLTAMSDYAEDTRRPSTEALSIAGIAVEMAPKNRGYRGLAAAQKQ